MKGKTALVCIVAVASLSLSRAFVGSPLHSAAAANGHGRRRDGAGARPLQMQLLGPGGKMGKSMMGKVAPKLKEGNYLQVDDDVLAYDILEDPAGLGENQEPAVLYLPAFDTLKDDSKGNIIMDCAVKQDRTYAQVDWYGVGRSTGDFAKKGTVTRWTEDTLLILDHVMPTRKVIIVGGGIGMWVALNIARSHPDRIAGIMGLAADPDFTENLLWRFLPEETKNDIMEREYVSLYWGGQGYSISKALIEDGRKHLLLEGTDGGLNVSCPVRLLHGLDDKEVPYDISLKLAKRLKARDVTVTLIKGADHNMYGAFCAPYIRHAARDLISRCGSSSDLTGIGKVISNELSKTWS